jgi:hypothetical protein
MKQNMFKIFAVVLVVAMCAVMFTACVPSDPQKAYDNLKASDLFKDATVTITNASDASGLAGVAMPEGCETVVTAYNNNGTLLKFSDDDSVSLYYFKDADSAKAYFEKAQKQYEDSKIDAKAEYDKGNMTKEEYDDYIDFLNENKMRKSGKVVYSGTKEGLKAL